jgi:hypothetical protein
MFRRASLTTNRVIFTNPGRVANVARLIAPIMSATRRRTTTPIPPPRAEFFASPRVEALPLPGRFAHIGNGVARAPLAKKWNSVFAQSAL